jgi:hypothetical protein
MAASGHSRRFECSGLMSVLVLMAAMEADMVRRQAPRIAAKFIHQLQRRVNCVDFATSDTVSAIAKFAHRRW